MKVKRGSIFRRAATRGHVRCCDGAAGSPARIFGGREYHASTLSTEMVFTADAADIWYLAGVILRVRDHEHTCIFDRFVGLLRLSVCEDA